MMKDQSEITSSVAEAIRNALKDVKKEFPDSQIMFDGCIEVDGVPFYKPDWTAK